MGEPIFKKKDGSFKVAVFEHEGKTKEGKDYKFMNIALQRSYMKDPKDKNSWVNEVIYLRKTDVKKIEYLLGQAYNYVATINNEEQ